MRKITSNLLGFTEITSVITGKGTQTITCVDLGVNLDLFQEASLLSYLDNSAELNFEAPQT